MPRAAKVCPTPGCPLDQPCPTHTPKPWARTERRTEFPTKTRVRILRRDPTCRCTGCDHHQHACTQPSTQADHVTPIAWGGTNTITNGQGLCTACHTVKSKSEAAAGRRGHA